MPIRVPELGEIRSLRHRLGLTQRELADLAGVSQPLIARIETGTVDPRWSTARSIMEALNSVERRAVTLEEVMNRTILAVDPDEPVEDAIRLMRDNGFSQLPVLEGGAPVGSISEDTIVRALSSARDRSQVAASRVGDVCGPPFPSAAPGTTVDQAYRLLEDATALLVMEHGRVVGIVSKTDLLNLV